MRRVSLLSIPIVVVSVVMLSGTFARTSQLTTLPGSVARGERVLTTNGCLNCHSLNGKGGSRGPDLATPSKTAGTPAMFAASLWNHTPGMLAEFAALNRQPPDLKATDAADLFTYFYATLYFSPRGNAARGGTVFVEKQCSNCHSEILDTRSRTSL